MTTLDWVVLCSWIVFLVGYGLWRGRRNETVDQFLLAGKSMPWYAMGLSIMATQASAITFVSTTGQAYVDGLRFVQFYFGLPVAMVLIAAIAVPRFHNSGVYTAYEYLERRFDTKTRALVSLIFLTQRGLAAGVSLYAPAVVLSVILGWSDNMTTLLMGVLVVTYTTLGGIKAVTWADVLQMSMISAALLLSFGIALWHMPSGVNPLDALALAGAAGRLNAVVTHFDWNDRYTLWSGLIGGSFLALAYFGCDQSQVQRYLTGKNISQSRLSLVFNALAKVPLQFFILLIGAAVFVLFQFEKPPVLFQSVEMRNLQSAPEYPGLQERFDRAFTARKDAATQLVAARHSGNNNGEKESAIQLRQAQQEIESVRAQSAQIVDRQHNEQGFTDTNYVFLHYVTHYLPAGIVGLVIAVIFTAAMSSISGEINSLATVTVIDMYKRYAAIGKSDRHYLWASRLATLFWGVYAVLFARYVRGLGSLIEAVNRVGSLFYGGMLGAFVLAFFFPRVPANGAFFGVLAGEAAIFAAQRYTHIFFLWYNVIGALVVIATGLLWSLFAPQLENRTLTVRSRT